jgi:hypothetical protein
VLNHIHDATTTPNLDMRSVFCDTVVVDDGFTHHLWNPGLVIGSQIIELTGFSIDFHYAQLCWLPIDWLT